MKLNVKFNELNNGKCVDSSSNKTKTATYVLEFESQELRTQFKTHCISKGSDMKTELNNLIKSVLEKGN